MKGKENGSTEWQERAAKIFCVCIAVAGVTLALKSFASVILPFAAAFFIAWTVSGIAKRISSVTGIPVGFLAFIIVSALVLGLGVGVFYVCRHLLREISAIIASVSGGEATSLGNYFGFLEKIPVLSALSDGAIQAENELGEWTLRILGSLGNTVGEILGRVARATPSALISGVVSVVAVYYMSVDFDGVCQAFSSLLPESARQLARRIRSGAVSALAKLAKAYAVIFVITFCEIFVGLLIICPSYACLGALAVAAVDILPVFGAGLILIPWGIISLLTGETAKGVGLLVLYAAVTVVRQIIEPRIVGESMGIHPLGAMIAMLVGYKAFGFLGMMLAPSVIFIAINTKKNGGLYRKATVDTDDLSRDK